MYFYNEGQLFSYRRAVQPYRFLFQNDSGNAKMQITFPMLPYFWPIVAVNYTVTQVMLCYMGSTNTLQRKPHIVIQNSII